MTANFEQKDEKFTLESYLKFHEKVNSKQQANQHYQKTKYFPLNHITGPHLRVACQQTITMGIRDWLLIQKPKKGSTQKKLVNY